MSGTSRPARTTPTLAHPGPDETDPLRIVMSSLDWYRQRVLDKLDGLDSHDLRRRLDPPDWSPLGLVQHLTWVERRWIRWGFAGEPIAPYPDDEWEVPHDVAPEQVLDHYRAELTHARTITAAARFDSPSALGGRFRHASEAPSLGRVAVHLLQEYARHLGQLDIVRETLDGTTGE